MERAIRCMAVRGGTSRTWPVTVAVTALAATESPATRAR